MSEGFFLFDTSLGTCAVVWRGEALIRVMLPEGDEARLRSRAVAAGAEARETPPIAVRDAAERIAALLGGRIDDLADVQVDWEECPELDRRIYAAARAIPPGVTRTYGEVAAAAGEPGAARQVGAAMARNRCPVVVPCHRVIGADGRLVGFSAPGGLATKVRLLEIERAAVGGKEPSLFGDLPLAIRER